MRKAVGTAAALLACAQWSFAQSERFRLDAAETAVSPVIDGTVHPSEWQHAAVATDFIQFVPHNGKPASLATVVRVLYDNGNLYVAFSCVDPQPRRVQLGAGRRDGLASGTGTDSVTVEIDSLNDDRTSYYFRTNPLGVQHDGRTSENGRISDTDWDGIWKSAGRWTDEGWSAEMAIPLRTIRYRPGTGQTWGIQFSRYLPRNFEKSFWTGPFDDYTKVSEHGALVGLDLPKVAERPLFIPHIVSRTQSTDGTGAQVGVDVRHQLTHTVSGYATVNPDFSTVEADQEVVNLTRFELNLPEKRPFFIDGNDAYKQPIRLFYSRRVSDIYGGVKVHGKSGPYEISILTTQTKRDRDRNLPSANISSLRLKRDVLGSSNVGCIAANRLVTGTHQGSLGCDTSLYLTNTVRLLAQAAVSYGEAGKTDAAFVIKPSYNSTTVHAEFGYQQLGEHFGDTANAVGFIPDDNRRELDAALNKTFWMKKWNIDRIEYKSDYDVYWSMDGTLRGWDVQQSIRGDLRNRFSLEARHARDFRLFEDTFRNHLTSVELGYNRREWRSFAVAYQAGRNFGAGFRLYTAEIKQNVTRRLSVQYNLSNLSYRPDPDAQSTWIHVIVADQYFTNDLFLKCFYQVNSAIDKRNAQVVLVYRPQPPFGLMQLAYEHGNSRFGETGSEGHIVFLKVAYVF